MSGLNRESQCSNANKHEASSNFLNHANILNSQSITHSHNLRFNSKKHLTSKVILTSHDIKNINFNQLYESTNAKQI